MSFNERHGDSVNANVLDLAEEKRRNALYVLGILLRAYVPKNTSDSRELDGALKVLTEPIAGPSLEPAKQDKATLPAASASPVEAVEVLTELVKCEDRTNVFPRTSVEDERAMFTALAAAWDRARKLVAQPPQAGQEVRPNHKQNWPKEMRVGRLEDMSPDGKLEVMLDGDSDVIVAVSTGGSEKAEWRNASVEFCTVGMGGGSSPRTRAALIDLMHAIEADNAETPRRAWPPKLAAATTEPKHG